VSGSPQLPLLLRSLSIVVQLVLLAASTAQAPLLCTAAPLASPTAQRTTHTVYSVVGAPARMAAVPAPPRVCVGVGRGAAGAAPPPPGGDDKQHRENLVGGGVAPFLWGGGGGVGGSAKRLQGMCACLHSRLLLRV